MPAISGQTIAEILIKRAHETPDAIVFLHKRETWQPVTFAKLFDDSRLLAHGLASLGLKAGDHVMVIAEARYECIALDFAIQGARGVPVFIDPQLPIAEMAQIIFETKPRVVFFGGTPAPDKIKQLRKKHAEAVSSVQTFISLDDVSIKSLHETGTHHIAKCPYFFETNLLALRPEDVFTISFTERDELESTIELQNQSAPRIGAIISHRNVMSVLLDCRGLFARQEGLHSQTLLAFLPYSHISGRLETLATLFMGWTQYFAPPVSDLEKLLLVFREVRPTLIFANPYFLESVYEKTLQSRKAMGLAKRKLFEIALDAGKIYWRLKQGGERPPLRLVTQYAALRRAALTVVKETLGGNITAILCPGKTTAPNISDFFRICGIQVFETFGMTETCVALTWSDESESAGKPLAEVSIRIADDGEIFIRSDKVFLGYLNRPEETAKCFRQGWYATGDIGFLDDRGRLHVLGRKGALIAAESGHFVLPERVESQARTHRILGDIVLFGKQNHPLSALVTLNRQEAIRYAVENHILFADYASLIRNAKIRTHVGRIIDQINAELPPEELIRKFVILPQEFSIESGELTPTRKLRRARIARKYRAELDSLLS